MPKYPAALILLLLTALMAISCRPESRPGDDFRTESESIYRGLMEEYGRYNPDDPEMSEWKYSFHPMIHAAWIYRGRLRVDRDFSNAMQGANMYFWRMDDEITSQVREGAVELDRERFLAIIEQPGARARTRELMDEGVSSLNAFARAFMEDVIRRYPDAPDMILNLLGKAYTRNPEIEELPVGTATEDENTQWRDWLQVALAASGSAGVDAVLDWDKKIESLQDLVPGEDFWNGRLSHAFVLRTIQMAKGSALDKILSELAQYRSGGVVDDFHEWMYWNLGRTLDDGGSMFPYSDEDKSRVQDFLNAGMLEGPVGEGEEANVVAETLGRSPSIKVAEDFAALARSADLECERRKLGYVGLGKVFSLPFDQWATTVDDRIQMREMAMSLLEDGGLECGNVPVLEFYSAVLLAFSDGENDAQTVGLTDSDLLRIHEAFVALLPSLTAADERAIALDLLLQRLVQPDFMMAHPELGRYRDIFISLCDDWSTTTTFEGSQIGEEQFRNILRLFRDSLGYESGWVNE